MLSRIIKTCGTYPSAGGSETNSDWKDEVTLEIGHHLNRSETQKKVVELDHGMPGGRANIHLGKALLYYALRSLGLGTHPTARRPQDQQVVLPNRDAAVPGMAQKDNGEAWA